VRDHITRLALKLVGCPYIWGGNAPWNGFDCSGFIVWVLQVFAILPSGDWTAATLAAHFSQHPTVPPNGTLPGDLAFYGSDPLRPVHVMLCTGAGTCVGASGGGPTTTSLEIARAKHAMVKPKPITYRNDLISCVRTFEDLTK
jgi:cell wall-associated NlpC family hydrolase